MVQKAVNTKEAGAGRKRRGRGRATTRQPLIDAAVFTIRAQGYAGTSIDDLCRAAGVSKGAFFHHFDSKETLAIAAADSFSDMANALFANAPYHDSDDPFERLTGYIDFRKAILQGDLPEFTCLLGTMVQEVYGNHPRIREACERHIWAHAAGVEAYIAAAMTARGIVGDWTAESLALHTQAVLQGAFILAKANGGPQIAADSIDHLRRYVGMLFNESASMSGTGGSACPNDRRP
jgi:TetR/AcrR family transcriptional regulator, transcriptional repressor for nem operon